MRRAVLLLTLSLRNVFRNRRRSIFALATIAAGTLGLFVFMGFNRGLMNQYRATPSGPAGATGSSTCTGTATRPTPGLRTLDPEPSVVMTRLRGLPSIVISSRVTSAPSWRPAALRGSQGEASTASRGWLLHALTTPKAATSGIARRDRARRGVARGLGVHPGDEIR